VVAIARSSKRKVLGVSLGDRCAAVAEVAWNGVGPRVARACEFKYPAGMTLDEAAAVGAGLGVFLRERGFTARQAVVGVPAKFLICRGQTIPPADAETAAAMLRLRGEAESAAELGEMVFDFAGEPSETAASNVLLVGMPRKRLDVVRAVLTAAGLSVSAVTVGAMALAGAVAAAGRAGGAVVLSVRADGAELTVYDGGQVRFLRHLGSTGAGLATELRRAAAVLPVLGGGGAGAGTRELIVFDEAGLDASALESLGAAVGMPVVRGDLKALGVAEDSRDGAGARVSASAVALAAVGGGRPAVDFMHPRIVAPVQRSVSRRAVWATTAGAAVVLVGALAYADLSKLQRQVAETDQELRQLDPAYKLAKPFVADMKFAETFSGGKPRYLACLRDVTQAMPEGGQAYLTGFHLRANMQGELIGRATSNQDVLNLLEKLRAAGRFVELRRKLDARGSGNDVSFYVTFTYVPMAEPPATRPVVSQARAPG
jgi:hypothetical protein